MAEPRTLREALSHGRQQLEAEGVEDAALEAEVLLRHALGLGRAAFLARLAEVIAVADFERYEKLIARRLAHEPSAYITGHQEFYGAISR